MPCNLPVDFHFQEQTTKSFPANNFHFNHLAIPFIGFSDGHQASFHRKSETPEALKMLNRNIFLSPPTSGRKQNH